jgi:glycosyltransferase involved in cell wall biosynthesis
MTGRQPSNGRSGTTLDVLQVITNTDRRGAQVFATDLDRALTALGRVVRTVALVNDRPVDALDVPSLGSRRLGPATIRALRAETRQARVVVAHGSTTLPACALATIGTRTPFVYRNIGDPAHWGTTRARRIRSALFLRQAHVVVALTLATATEITNRYRVDAAKITVIPKAVSAERFAPSSAETRKRARRHFELPDAVPVALCLGALSPEKNVTLAIEAVAELPDVHLLVVGDGSERASIEADAARLAPGRVHVAGSTDRPEVALAAADVVVVSSWTEGLPGTFDRSRPLCAPRGHDGRRLRSGDRRRREDGLRGARR